MPTNRPVPHNNLPEPGAVSISKEEAERLMLANRERLNLDHRGKPKRRGKKTK